MIVRQKISVHPQATGKMFSLFPEMEEHRTYRYSAHFTNLDFAPAELRRLYNDDRGSPICGTIR
jgi:hypothetical protein